MIINRKALGKLFGENPVVGIRLTVEQAEEPILQERKFDEQWYLSIGSSDLADVSNKEGYQYDVVCAMLTTREHLIPESVTSANKSFHDEKGLVVKVEVQVFPLDFPGSSLTLPTSLSR